MNYRITTIDRTNARFKTRLEDPAPLMEGLAARAHSAIIHRVDQGVGPANAALTVAVKRGDKTLRDNGQLLGSIHPRSGTDFAEVASNHIAAIVNNPPDDSTSFTVTPKKAKFLTVPAGPQTRTMMRRYGWTPSAVIGGMQAAGYSVFRPFKKGSNAVRANVIMAVLKTGGRGNASGRRLKSGRTSQASKWQPFVLFYLRKSVKVPIRRFMYLTEPELAVLETYAEDFYLG